MSMTPQIQTGGQRAPASDDTRVVLRGGTLGLIGFGASSVLQFVLVLVITHGLPTREAGVFIESIALFSIAASFATFGAELGLVRTLPRLRTLGRVHEMRTTTNSAVASVMGLSAVAVVVLFVAAHSLADAFYDVGSRPLAIEYIHVLAPFIPAMAMVTLFLAATRAIGSMVPWTAAQAGLPALRVALVGATVAVGASATAVGAGWAAPTLAIGAFLCLTYLRRQRRMERRHRVQHTQRFLSTSDAAAFWRFSAARGLASMAGSALTWLDVLLVGHYRSPRDAAVYAAASRLAVLGTLGLQAIGAATQPRISSLLTAHEFGRVQRLYHAAAMYATALMWPFYVFVMVFAGAVMGVFGAEFESGAHPLVILSVAMMFNVATGNVTGILLMSGKSGWALGNSVTTLSVNVVLNVILIPRYGIPGAAVAWATCIIVNNLLAMAQVRWLTGIVPFARAHLEVGLAAVGCFGVISLIARGLVDHQYAAMGVALLIASPAYLGLLWSRRRVVWPTQADA
jgi:O-antigen/teichoic acid export membrane protein